MTPKLTAPSRALLAGLAAIGWEVRRFEIDTVAKRVTLELHRADGRWLHMAGDAHKATIERWARTWSAERPCRQAPLGDVPKDEFLGRVRAPGIHAALREACLYLATNPAPGRTSLHASSLRPLFTIHLEDEERAESNHGVRTEGGGADGGLSESQIGYDG